MTNGGNLTSITLIFAALKKEFIRPPAFLRFTIEPAVHYHPC